MKPRETAQPEDVTMEEREQTRVRAKPERKSLIYELEHPELEPLDEPQEAPDTGGASASSQYQERTSQLYKR